MISEILEWIVMVLATVGALIIPLFVPAIREAVANYVSSFVQHNFARKIEELKSELRHREEKFAADLKINEQQLRSIADTALSLRSSRQAALDERRLRAVEKLWEAKIATDRMKVTASMVAHLNLEELYKAASNDDPKVMEFARKMVELTGVDLKKQAPQASVQSERPFLTPSVWSLFSAYQGVMVVSVLHLQTLAAGVTKFLKEEDKLKPVMLLAMPEYEGYIEKYGFSGYYNLLDSLEQKLLNAIAEMLDGKAVDDATLRRNAEIISLARDLNIQSEPEIPKGFRSPRAPDPTKG